MGDWRCGIILERKDAAPLRFGGMTGTVQVEQGVKYSFPVPCETASECDTRDPDVFRWHSNGGNLKHLARYNIFDSILP